MKSFPEIDNCYNCNESYNVPTDPEGNLETEGSGSYLCQRCRNNPNIKMQDYMAEIKCSAPSCSRTFWRAKKYSHLSKECLNCCLYRRD